MAKRTKVTKTINGKETFFNRPKEIIVKSDSPTCLIVDGKKYIFEKETFKKIDKVEHSDKMVFRELNEDQYEYYLNLVVDTIADNVAKKEMIREIVKKIDYKTLRRLATRIEDGKDIKKQKGCIGFKIGDAYIQLID